MSTSPPVGMSIVDATASSVGALRVGRNVVFRLVSQALSALVNIAGMALLGNALPASGYGEYAFWYALIVVAASVTDLGIGIIVTREMARDRAASPRWLGDALLAKTLIGGTLLAAVATVAAARFDPAHALLAVIVALTALVDIGQDPSVWVLRAREQLHVEAGLLLLSQVVWLGALALAVHLHAPLPMLIGAATLAFLVRLATGALFVSQRLVKPRFEFDAARLRRLVWQGVPFGAAMLVVVLYGRVGLLVLKALARPADVAAFQVSYLLSQPLGFIASAFSVAAFPMFARHARNDPIALRRGLRYALKYQCVLALPLTVGLFMLAPRVIALLFHRPGYEQAALGLQVTSLGLPMIFLNLLSRYSLAAMDRERRYLHAVLVGLLVNLAACALLVPRWGFLGACTAYIGAETSITLVSWSGLFRFIGPFDRVSTLVKPAVAAAGMAVLVHALRHANLLLIVAAGGIAYAGLLLALRTFSRPELNLLGRVTLPLRLHPVVVPARTRAAGLGRMITGGATRGSERT